MNLKWMAIIGVPIILMTGGAGYYWTQLEDKGKATQQAADAVADAAVAAANAASEWTRDKEIHVVNLQPFVVGEGALAMKLEVKGGRGLRKVCQHLPHVRDKFVEVLLEDPPALTAKRAQFSLFGYDEVLLDAVNELFEDEPIAKVRVENFSKPVSSGTGCVTPS